MDLQPIYNLAEICAQAGITDAVLSPGSRCAPLVLAFTRHPSIKSRTVNDERSAAFIAMGIAQIQKRPVVLICTSGSAAYNYAPAVAEAFFQQVPLILLTADRPPEWIGQQDGQTIWQDQLYGKHVHLSKSALPDLTHPDAKWHLKRIMNEAINSSINQSGPVHINMPFREPFYPDSAEETYYESDAAYVSEYSADPRDKLGDEGLIHTWRSSSRKLILAGQGDLSAELSERLSELSDGLKIPIVGDIISNVHKVENGIQISDVTDAPSPDLLITFGNSVLSKSLKVKLRSQKPQEHWHIQASGNAADPFQSITKILRISPEVFFEEFSAFDSVDSFSRQKQENYFRTWDMEYTRIARQLEGFFEPGMEFGEFELVYNALKAIPEGSNLHLANSMAVRYANICGLPSNRQNVTVYSNRGTCGIDGCTSTAVGAAIADPDRLNVLITGDVAFFYDRNAFWHNYTLDNLRIILLNNHGGGIFRMIQGPSKLEELEPFFETKQQLNARMTCDEFGIEYLKCDKRSKMKNFLSDLMKNNSRPALLEVETTSISNAGILEKFRNLQAP